jgi:hypothetical protein
MVEPGPAGSHKACSIGRARMNGRAVPVGFAAVATALALVSPTPASTPARDPLVGTWQTPLIPLAKVSATLSAHGYTASQIDNFLHKNTHYVEGLTIRIRFYRESGTPFQIVYSWDPTSSPLPDGDHGPYSLLPGDRVVYRGTDPPTDTWRTTFAYTVTGAHLRLRFISLVEPGVTAAQLHSDQKRPILMASTVFKRLQ